MSTFHRITVVQSITTGWSKQSRGAPGAIKRNAVPEALIIPLAGRPKAGCGLIEHLSGFYEYNDFEDPNPTLAFESFDPEEAVRYGCVLVRKQDEGLRVSWEYRPEDAGMPLRPTKRHDSFHLNPNQWGQVIYNGRYSSDEGGWWYKKTVLNIGLFDAPEAKVFVETTPAVVFDKTAILY